MKRLAVILAFCVLAAAPAAFGQAGEGEKGAASTDEGKWEVWRWANFLILAGGLGYLIGKSAPPFFEGRARKIREEMAAADDLRKQAERRAAEVDRRLASLESEIAALSAESEREAVAERERTKQQIALEIAKIREHAEQEIAGAGKSARLELKRHAAELAVHLAEQKIRNRMTPATQDELVQGFVNNLKSPSSPAQSM